jgi:hypothetical protein
MSIQSFSNCGAHPLGGGRCRTSSRGARVDCMRDIFILNEIWVQGKICLWHMHMGLILGAAVKILHQE